jgi:diguanylate cyclase (GGDEF)-like protein
MMERYANLPEDKNKINEVLLEKVRNNDLPSSGNKAYDSEDGLPVFLQSFPVYKNGKAVASIYSTRTREDYRHYLGISFFNDAGYTYIADDKGNVEINSAHRGNLLTENSNLFAFMEQNKAKVYYGETFGQMRENLLSHKSGGLSYRVDETYKYMYYTPLGINDWYMIAIVPSAQADNLADGLVVFVAVFSIVLILAFLGLAGYIYVSSIKYDEELFNAAFKDPLTRADNLAKFKADFAAAMNLFPRDNFAFVLFDIERFKIINTMYGNKQGDMILKHVADALRGDIKEPCAFARMFSDMFIVLLRYENDADIITRVENLDAKLKDHYANTDSNFVLDFNYGIYKVIEKDLPFYNLVDKANIARVNAKSDHSQKYAFYSDNCQKTMLQASFVKNNIKRAISNGEIQIMLQPIIDLKTGKIAAAEALSRWLHPSKGLIMPDSFIPLLEQSGDIVNFDYYVLESAAKIMAKIENDGLSVVPFAVNYSRRHLKDPKYPEIFRDIITARGIRTHAIELEISESATVGNLETVMDFSKKLHELGFKLCMDDFGAGHSSLGLLKDIEVDIVKLDKSFLKNFSSNERGRKIISDSIAMIKKLGGKIVAEGVEDKEQADFLRGNGCDFGQGFYFAKPVTVEVFTELLGENKIWK